MIQWICFRLCLTPFIFFFSRTSLTVKICEFITTRFDLTGTAVFTLISISIRFSLRVIQFKINEVVVLLKKLNEAVVLVKNY